MVEREFDEFMEAVKTDEIKYKNPSKEDAVCSDNNDDRRFTDLFEDFSSSTTLHGVRFIGDHTSLLPRRLIWLGVILLSASIFTIQVVDRVTYYIKSPVTVNYQVNYNKSLKFPAITICNQNAFRVTSAYRKKLHFIIEEMYRDNAVYRNMSDDVYNITLDVLYTDLAHTKENLIIGCYWGNQKCYSWNFTTTLTSNGVCYTFNKVNSSKEALTVEASGVDAGLRLTLNTESYEKMSGPHKTDGIKLIATDQSEIPSVEEIGLAISAGAHAFVGLNVISLNNLEPPYGRCGSSELLSTDRYTPDSCLLECETNYVVGICKCRHFYMPNLDGDTRICNVRDFFTCLQRAQKMFNEEKDVICECPTSCTYNIYETSVSYAKKPTSESFYNSKSLSQSRREHIIETFFTAKEIRSRIDVTGDLYRLKYSIENTLNFFNRLVAIIDEFKMYTQEDRIDLSTLHNETMHASVGRETLYTFQLFIVEKNFIGGRDAMEENSFGVLCRGYNELLVDIYHKVTYLLFSDDETISTITYMLLDGLVNSKIDIGLSSIKSLTDLLGAYRQGDPILNHTYRSYTSYVHSAAIPKKLLHDSLTNHDIANGSVFDHKDIKNIIDKLYNFYMIFDRDFSNQSHDIDLIDSVRSIGKKFSEACETYLDKKSIFYSEVIEKPAKILTQRKNKLAILKSNYKFAYESVKGNIDNIYSACIDARRVTLQPLSDTLEGALTYFRYEDGNTLTKFAVADTLSGPETSAKIRNLEMMLADIKARIIGISESLPIMINRLYDIWKHMLEYSEDNGPYDLMMNDSVLSKNYYERRQLFDERLLPMHGRHMRTTVRIEQIDHDAIEKIKDVIHQMKTYVESHAMDDRFHEENFLEVDIFFKELRSEQIDQQKAYDEFDLLCDIGGSMGLFIGGSAITFFEIVDFLIICCVQKFCRRKL